MRLLKALISSAEITDQDLLQQQDESLPAPEDINYSTNEPDFPQIYVDGREPDEFDDLDSDDERVNVLTAENYPMIEFPVDPSPEVSSDEDLDNDEELEEQEEEQEED
ncbi:hypothetical protein HBI18_048620 [Parastagonospora nodorum]|nr:hypothetical protein HBI18_048620 [Parastagonospora nodorum]